MVMDRTHVFEVLREVGIEEAVASRLADVLEEDRAKFVTKDDMKEAIDSAVALLELRIAALDQKFDREIASVRRELDLLRNELQQLRNELQQLRNELNDLRKEMAERDERLRREMRWAFGVLFTLIVVQMGIVIGFAV